MRFYDTKNNKISKKIPFVLFYVNIKAGQQNVE